MVNNLFTQEAEKADCLSNVKLLTYVWLLKIVLNAIIVIITKKSKILIGAKNFNLKRLNVPDLPGIFPNRPV